MEKYKESGVERLRRIVSACDMTMESAFDDLTVAEVINVIEACWSCPYDILPDSLDEEERIFAARNGRLSAQTLRRLDKDLG